MNTESEEKSRFKVKYLKWTDEQKREWIRDLAKLAIKSWEDEKRKAKSSDFC